MFQICVGELRNLVVCVKSLTLCTRLEKASRTFQTVNGRNESRNTNNGYACNCVIGWRWGKGEGGPMTQHYEHRLY